MPPTVALKTSWNHVVLTAPASRTTRMLRLEARLTDASGSTPWIEFTYDVNIGDGSDVLTVEQAVGLEAYTLEVRGIVYYDNNETPHYGAYPAGSDWPVSAQLGAFGRGYQIRFTTPDRSCEHFGTSPFELPSWVQQSGTWAAIGGSGKIVGLGGAGPFGTTKAFARYPVGSASIDLSVDVTHTTLTNSYFSIQSNKLAGSSSAAAQFMMTDVGSGDVTLDVDWTASLAASTAGLLLHYVDTANFFVATRDGIYRMNGGSWSLLATYSGSVTFGAGDHMQVAITTGGGFHPIVKRNGTQVAILTVGGGGAIQTSTLNGFYCASDGTTRWDNWAASGCTTPSTDAFTGADGSAPSTSLWTTTTFTATANSSIVFAYDPTTDTGYSLDYNGGTTVSLVQHNGSTPTTLATATVSTFTTATFGISYSAAAGTIVVTKGGAVIINTDLHAVTFVFTDAFNRSDSTSLGAGWSYHTRATTAGTLGIAGSAVTYGGGGSGFNPVIAVPDAVTAVGSADFDMTFTAVTVASTTANLANFRVSATGDGTNNLGYWSLLADRMVTLRPNEGGGTLYSVSPAIAAGDVVRVKMVGRNLDVWVNGSSRISVVMDPEPTLQGVMHGIGIYPAAPTTKIDNLSITSAGPATALTGTWAGLMSDTAGADAWDEFCWGPAGELTIDEFTPSGYVAAADKVIVAGFGGIVSTTDGQTWSIEADGSLILSGAYDSAHRTMLAYDFAGPSLLRSVDNGATWTVDSNLVHPSASRVAGVNLSFDNGVLLATYSQTSGSPTATDYKIAYSSNEGASWQFSNPIASAYQVTAPRWTGAYWYCLVEMQASPGGQSFGVFRSSDLVAWTQLTSPTLLTGDSEWYITGTTYSWSSSPSRYFSLVYSQAVAGSFNGTRLLYTTNGGSTVTLVKPHFANANQYVRSAWRNPVTGTIIGAVRESSLLGGSVDHTTIWRSTDDGFTWSFGVDFLADHVEAELATFNRDGDVFLLAGLPSQKVYVSRDDGHTFAELGPAPVPLANVQGSEIGDIEVAPGPGIVFFDYPLPPAVPDIARVHFLPIR